MKSLYCYVFENIFHSRRLIIIFSVPFLTALFYAPNFPPLSQLVLRDYDATSAGTGAALFADQPAVLRRICSDVASDLYQRARVYHVLRLSNGSYVDASAFSTLSIEPAASVLSTAAAQRIIAPTAAAALAVSGNIGNGAAVTTLDVTTTDNEPATVTDIAATFPAAAAGSTNTIAGVVDQSPGALSVVLTLSGTHYRTLAVNTGSDTASYVDASSLVTFASAATSILRVAEEGTVTISGNGAVAIDLTVSYACTASSYTFARAFPFYANLLADVYDVDFGRTSGSPYTDEAGNVPAVGQTFSYEVRTLLFGA
jgi:hypothetical protein